MLHLISKLKASRNLCSGIHTLNKYVTPYRKDLTQTSTKQKKETIDDRKKVWLNLPYLGNKADHLTKSSQMFW